MMEEGSDHGMPSALPEPFLRTRARRRLYVGLAGVLLTTCIMAVPMMLWALNVWLVGAFVVFAWIAVRAAWYLRRNSE